MKLNGPTPITEIIEKLFERMQVRLFIKREDLLHPVVSGNKWRKLKFNLALAEQEGYSDLLTLGGAYSNHIVAVAYAAKVNGFGSIGIIRGEEASAQNPSMKEAASYGMKLHFVTRHKFSQRESDQFINELHDQYGSFYLIPEGGANDAGVSGVEELAGELKDFSHIIMPVGTGTTLAGIVNGKSEKQNALGIAVLKGEGYLEKNTRRFINQAKDKKWSINHDFHFGGYAKFTPELVTFINEIWKKNGIQLDPVYTGKMILGIYKLIDAGYFLKGSEIVAIHTGGTQGIAGFNKRFGNLIVSD